MKQDIKSRWVEALRSGKYTQTKAVLHDNRGYCCLGVLCELISPNWTFVEEDNHYLHHFGGVPSETMPRFRLLAEVELSYDDAEQLASMNDDDKSFSEIADYIERELLD